MDSTQFDRLIAAIERNTEAQVSVAQAHLASTEATHRLADECVTLATMLADPQGEAAEGTHALDMAGRPIGEG